jgi:hypothetical protein
MRGVINRGTWTRLGLARKEWGMLILAIHQTPSLTQERYEEVVRRLTGKSRIDSPSDLPFEGLLVHAAGEGPNGFCVFDVFASEEAVDKGVKRGGRHGGDEGTAPTSVRQPP